MSSTVVITASCNFSHMEHMKIISVCWTAKLVYLCLNLAYRGEGDLPFAEPRSDRKTQASDPCLPRHGAEGKHTHSDTLSLTEIASSHRSYLTKHFLPPYKCQLYGIWRI